ncbi:hypothetical protein C8Q76DRAFT_769915 [Earliella scabrosa]|nr:hypothetical protein C8Q76DRAFT_769915 [Earliella scabrosa]
MVPWPDAAADVIDALERAYERTREVYRFSKKHTEHRRGDYAAISSGISFGGGQQRVGNLKDSEHNKAVVRNVLLNNPAMQRAAGIIDSIFMAYAPKMYTHYANILHSVCAQNPGLEVNFMHNVFAAATFNLGPRTSTLPHLDHLNIAGGLCALVAMGDFEESGSEDVYIILWDLGLMVRFPRRTIIFLPSALFLHSNTIVTAGRRYSLTMYTAGGLARWVECDGMSQKAYLAAGHRLKKTGEERWKEALDMFPVWDD